MSHISVVTHPVLYIKRKWCLHKYKSGRPLNSITEKDVNGVRFVLDPSLGAHINRMYYDWYGFPIKEAMKKYLKQGGCFIDIGANIGYISAVGAGFVGKSGFVHSFEPVPAYFQYLLRITELNADYNIVVNSFALGEHSGNAYMNATEPPAIGASSMVPGFIPEGFTGRAVQVPVVRLDEYIESKRLDHISLIKIDVEGFEIPVLKGASGFFKKHRNNLPPVIVECTPARYRQLNTSLEELEEFMTSYKYRSYCLFGRCRINIKRIRRTVDILFRQ
ncbi:MAG TPA: FkbM family methyltransferase [Sedimentisphaerales bacterium]|nr:FkbM family methyltransferase [Sedimentisphaerales bacterium]